MKLSNFTVRFGSREVRGLPALLLGLIIAIPVIAFAIGLIGLVLSFVGVVVGGVIMVALVIAGIALLIGVLSLLLPKKWRDKLGIFVQVKRSSGPKKADKTPEGNPIIDVQFEEDDKV